MKSYRNMMLATMFMLLVFIAYSSAAFSYDFPVEVPPPWLKVGTYVEYDCITWTLDVVRHEKPFVLRWDCIALKGLVATLNISAYELPMGNISAVVDIVTNTRDLLNANGTVLGKACLWLPSNPKVGDRIVVSGKPPNELNAEVRQSGGVSSITCQGFQETYWALYSQGRIFVSGDFDLDTGLIIELDWFDYTMTLSVLELIEQGWIKFLRATNVDLGPRYWRTEILTFLWNTMPIWLPSIIFVTTFVILVRKRRKRHHLKKAKTKVTGLNKKPKSLLPFFLVFMMKCRTNLTLVVIFMLIVSIACGFPVSSDDYPAEVPPSWLKAGTYAEYDCITYVFEVSANRKPFVFRWECTALSGLVATLNLTVTGHPTAGNFSVMVDIIMNTRELLYPNGTALGKAGLWLPPNLKVGDRVVVSGKPPNEIIAEVTQLGGGSSITCQGFQEIYVLFDIKHRFMFDGFFDLDTGLVVTDPDLDFVMPHGVLGLGGTSWLEFLRATNVDLGPRYWRTEILTFLWNMMPIWLPTIIFIITFIVLVRKHRKRRHLKQAKISKTKSNI